MNLATKKVPTPLVPGRECGSCSACCVSLRINTKALIKPADVECKNLTPAKGCAIYASRPSACRSFHCGWRMLGGLDDTWRPDRSKVMIRVEQEGLVVQGLASMKQILAKKVLEFIGTCVANGITIFVNMPAHKGRMATKLPLNDLLASANTAKTREVIMRELIKAIEANSV